MRTFSLIVALLFISHLCIPILNIAPIAFAAAGGSASSGGSVFQGGGLQTGIDEAKNITGVSQRELRPFIVNAITTVVNILGLLAAASIIICGMILIFSFGEETTKDKAKKGVLYSAIGLLVILFAKALVTFITTLD